MIYLTTITNTSLPLKCDKIYKNGKKIVLVYEHTAIYTTGKTNKRSDICTRLNIFFG